VNRPSINIDCCHGFDWRPFHFYVTTLDRSFTHIHASITKQCNFILAKEVVDVQWLELSQEVWAYCILGHSVGPRVASVC